MHDLAQGYLMKQGRLTSKWSRGFFRLDDGLLAHYENKSLVGTNPKKVLVEPKVGDPVVGGGPNSHDSGLMWPFSFPARGGEPS